MPEGFVINVECPPSHEASTFALKATVDKSEGPAFVKITADKSGAQGFLERRIYGNKLVGTVGF